MSSQIIQTGLGESAFVDIVAPRIDGSGGYEVALGSYRSPGAWQQPTQTVVGTDTVTLRLLVGNNAYNPVRGRYWKWWRTTNGAEHVERTSAADTVEIDTSGGHPIGTGVPWVTTAEAEAGDAETLAAAKTYTDQHAGGPGGGAAVVDNGNGTFTLTP